MCVTLSTDTSFVMLPSKNSSTVWERMEEKNQINLSFISTVNIVNKWMNIFSTTVGSRYLPFLYNAKSEQLKQMMMVVFSSGFDSSSIVVGRRDYNLLVEKCYFQLFIHLDLYRGKKHVSNSKNCRSWL